MDGASYDAAGNLLAVPDPNGTGTLGLRYDARNRPVAVSGNITASYAYDAAGRRVERASGGYRWEDFYDRAGHAVTVMERDSSYNQWAGGEVWAGGEHLATYTDATTYFSLPDGLGTERARTRPDGSLYETCVSLPFGDGQACSFPNGAATDSPLHFTGQPRDPETGLDDFPARSYTSTSAAG